MEESIIISILKKQVSLGKSSISIAALIPVLFFITAAMSLNFLYLKRYNKLLAYLEKFYPEFYEKIYRKPDFGPFYTTGYRHRQPVLELTQEPKLIDDPTAQRILSDFLKFDQQFTWMGSILIIAGLLSFLAINFVLSN